MNEKMCAHASESKIFVWKTEPFSERFNAEYEFCVCAICNTSNYTGSCRFTPVLADLNRDKIPSAKEQNMSSNEKASRSLKARHTKEGKGLSLKEFARRLIKAGDPVAKNWLANKKGASNQKKDEKNKIRISAERVASKNARRSKKKGGGGSTTAATTTAKK